MNTPDPVRFRSPSPVLRIFDEIRAREFYCDVLDFLLSGEHRFEPGLPLYAEVERGGLRLHLSGHHGDACPGSTVSVRMTGTRALQAELLAKDYGFARPGLQELP